MNRRDFIAGISAAGAASLKPVFAIPPDLAETRPDTDVKRVLVMFKCHLDVGFIDTQANLVRKYFDQYFPQAIELARAQNASGKRRYVWTTGSWLVFEYLEQAGPPDRKLMEQAIARGDIAWHALPFTLQTEMLDRSMIEASLSLSRALDHRFGLVTTGAKTTDVPGQTRGIVSPLAKHGIKFLDIGTQDACVAAKTPPIFLWKDSSGAALPTMYHLGYGGIARVPGSDLALVTCVRGDNSGPHTPDEIAGIYADLGRRFPNAEITATTLSEMASSVDPYRSELPVLAGEIGDTWIYGIASDPLKVARFRELSRLRDRWISDGSLQVGDAVDINLLRHLLLEVEHTWGADTPFDFNHYLPDDLARAIDTKEGRVLTQSWQEKRQELLNGIATLPPNLRAQAEYSVARLNAIEPQAAEKMSLHPAGASIETAHFILAIDPVTGALIRLRNKGTGREWASQSNPVGLFTYQTLSKEEFDRFIDIYLVQKRRGIVKDFTKPGIEKLGARSREWHPQSTVVRVDETTDAHRILISPQMEDDEAYRSGQASFPRKIVLELILPKATPEIRMDFYWFQKRATQLPEAMWLTFNPITGNQRGWMLEKSGEPISPFDVVVSGNRHMHSLSSGFSYRESEHTFAVETIDAPLTALGARTPIGFSNDQPDLRTGIHSNLFNNAWNTNYIMWYSDDARFRFVLKA